MKVEEQTGFFLPPQDEEVVKLVPFSRDLS